jgi:hypothetical protein
MWPVLFSALGVKLGCSEVGFGSDVASRFMLNYYVAIAMNLTISRLGVASARLGTEPCTTWVIIELQSLKHFESSTCIWMICYVFKRNKLGSK